MGKIISFINSFKAFLKSNRASAETTEIDRNIADDYVVERKSTAFYVLSIIISVLGAVLIWLVAVTNSSAVSEKSFAMPVQINEEAKGSFMSAADQSGFNVVIEENTTITFYLEGRKKVISDLTVDDINVYIDLNKYIDDINRLPNDKEQVISAEIIIDVPIYLNISDVSKKEVIIKLIPINKTSE
jgi:hypothetical protein